MYLMTWESGRRLVDLDESLRLGEAFNALGIRYTCRAVVSWPVLATAMVLA